jgi:hypothetical protein
MMFTGVPNLGGDLVACSKKCAVAAASKDKNGGDSRRSWDHDAKNADGQTSTSILMDWWTTHGNYATYRGKDNEGKTSGQVMYCAPSEQIALATRFRHQAAKPYETRKVLRCP